MAIQDSDAFLVERGGTNYQSTASDIMATIQDTDLMLVNRAGTNYKVTGLEVKDSLIRPWKAGDTVTIGNRFAYDPVKNILCAWSRNSAPGGFALTSLYPGVSFSISTDEGLTWISYGGYGAGMSYSSSVGQAGHAGNQGFPNNGMFYTTPEGKVRAPFPVSQYLFPVDPISVLEYGASSLSVNTWQSSSADLAFTFLETSQFDGPAQNPSTGTIIYTGSYYSGSQTFKAGRSTNYGVDWTNFTQPATRVQYLSTPNRWFMFSGPNSVYVSSNDGVSFTQATTPAVSGGISGFASISTSNILAPFVDYSVNPGPLRAYISTDGGTSFTLGSTIVNNAWPNSVWSTVFVVNGRYYLYYQTGSVAAGNKVISLFRSIDGSSWTSSDQTSLFPADFEVVESRAGLYSPIAVTPTYVYVGNRGGNSSLNYSVVFPTSAFT